MTSNRRQFGISGSYRDANLDVSARSTEDSKKGTWSTDRDATGSGNVTPSWIRDLLNKRDRQGEDEATASKRSTGLQDFIKHHLEKSSLNAEDLLGLRIHITKDQMIKKLHIHRKDIMQALANYMHKELSEYNTNSFASQPELQGRETDVVKRPNAEDILYQAEIRMRWVKEELHYPKNPNYPFGDKTTDRNKMLKETVNAIRDLYEMQSFKTDQQQSREPVGDEILESTGNLQHSLGALKSDRASSGNVSWDFGNPKGEVESIKSRKGEDHTGQNPGSHEVTLHQQGPDTPPNQSETLDWTDGLITGDQGTEISKELEINGEKFLSRTDRSTKKHYKVTFEDRYVTPPVKKMKKATPWNCDLIANIEKEHFTKVQSRPPAEEHYLYTNYYDIKHGVIIYSANYRVNDRIGSENDETTRAWQTSDVMAEQTKLVLKEQGENFFDVQTVIIANILNREMKDILRLLKVPPEETTPFRRGQKEFAMLFAPSISKGVVYLVDQNRELYGEGKVCTSVSVHMIGGEPAYMEYHFEKK